MYFSKPGLLLDRRHVALVVVLIWESWLKMRYALVLQIETFQEEWGMSSQRRI